jgi:DNA integrity scanning protein DisA with diadenylate cyclase activity
MGMKSSKRKNLLDEICSKSRNINTDTLRKVILLAIEIGREGREGRKIGTMFVISDSDKTLKRSRSLILDPLRYHPEKLKSINNDDMWETIKELAQLDGAFIVSDDGIVISACRYIYPSSLDIELPRGLGSRHIAAASISKETNAVVVVVSESSIIRIFDDGEIISEIIPELWLVRREAVRLKKPS